MPEGVEYKVEYIYEIHFLPIYLTSGYLVLVMVHLFIEH